MSIQSVFLSQADAKRAGWFSRRHQTSEAHFAEKDKREEREREKKQNALDWQEEALARREKMRGIDA